MTSFKHATVLLYKSHYTAEQIRKIFSAWTHQADLVTNGDRSIWSLCWTANRLMLEFKNGRDRDLFALGWKGHVANTSKPVGDWSRNGRGPAARTVMHCRESFEASYALEFDYLDAQQFGQLAGEVCVMADVMTGDDRSAYEVRFFDNEVSIGFKIEEDRDEFAAFIAQEAAADEGEFTALPLPADAPPHQITVH